MATLPGATPLAEPVRRRPTRTGIDALLQVGGMVGLMVAAFIAVSKLPLLFTPARVPAAGTPPSAGALLAVGLAVTVLSAGVVYMAIGYNGSFPKLVVSLMVAYNALIVLVKFVLGPPGVWHQTYIVNFFRGSLPTPAEAAANAVSSAGGAAIWQAVALFLLYAFGLLVVFLIYRFRTRAILRRYGHGLPAPRLLAAPLAALFIFSGSLIFVGAFVVPFMVANPYVRDLFTSGTGVLAAMMLAGAVAAASAAFQLTSARAVLVRDASLLTGLFWLGLTLLALYHILWVVYILTLVAMWPVKFTLVSYGK